MGMDWGIKEWKWAKVQTIGPGRHRLVFLDSLSLTEGGAQLVTNLKEYVLKNHLGGTPAAVCIQDDSLHIRKLELPRMPMEDLREAVRWQMRDIAEESMDDYIVRYSILEEIVQPEIVRLNLLGYAVKKIVVQQYLRILEKIGLRPFFVEPAPVSLAYTMERIFPSGENEWAACIDIGWRHAYFLAIGNGKLHFIKPLAGVSLEQAQVLQENFSEKLGLEIQHAIDAFSISHQIEKIEKLFLTGGGAASENLSATLSKNLGIVTELFNPFQGIEQTNEFALATEKPYLFGAALGLAFLKP